MNAQKIILSLAAGFLACTAVLAQEPVPTNRYAMKLEKKADGTYALQREARYAKILNLSEIPDLYVPYVHQNQRLSGKLYNKVETEEVVYKKYDSYELRIAIDKSMAEGPSPVMFFVHGGGWARGTFDSSRSLSKYLAQNHGITGVRIEYTLAPQPGANVQVSIADVLDAVQYIRDHAKELNIDTSRMGFNGASAGAHLSSVAAMLTKEAKVFVGYSGIYDLTTAAITTRAKDPQRIAYFGNLQEKYLADPRSGPCPFFKAGDTFLLKRTAAQDDFYHLMNGKFCGEAWDAVSRYVYTALQGGSIMQGWTNDDRLMIACCNDGTRPVIFKIERIDIPENEEEKEWLARQNFTNTAEDAYTG